MEEHATRTPPPVKAKPSDGYNLDDNEFHAGRDDFAYIDKDGRGHLYIGDEAHTRDALGRFPQTRFESAEAKKAAAKKLLARARKYGIEVDEDSAVAEAAKFYALLKSLGWTSLLKDMAEGGESAGDGDGYLTPEDGDLSVGVDHPHDVVAHRHTHMGAFTHSHPHDHAEGATHDTAAHRRIHQLLGISGVDDPDMTEAAGSESQRGAPTSPRNFKDMSLEDLRAAVQGEIDELNGAAVAQPMAPPPMPECYYLEETYPDYCIVSAGPCFYKIPFARGDDHDGDDDGMDGVILAPRAEWQEVEQTWAAKNLRSFRSLRKYGQTADTAKVGGWLVVYGDKDLYGDTFTKDTDFYLKALGTTKPVFYDHTFNPAVKNALLGTGTIVPSDLGLWFEMELDRHNAYCDQVLKLVEAGAAGLSSGTAEHLMRKEGSVIKAWPIVEGSITPTPAEPRTLGLAHLRSLVAHVEGLTSLLPDEPKTPHDAPKTSPAPRAVPAQPASPPQTKAAPPEPKAPPAVAAKAAPAPQSDTQENPVAVTPEQFDALKSQMDQITAILQRFDNEPNLKGSGLVSQDGGTADKNVKSFADYLLAIRRGDEARLLKHYGSTKAALNESAGEQGGYNVPTEFAARIQALAAENAIVRPRAGLVYPMMHREVEIPMLDQFSAPSAGNSAFLGGVVAGWVEEAAALSETEPKFKLMRLIAHGLGGYTLASNDLRADSAEALDALLTKLFGMAIGWYEDYAFLNGSGVGQPLGALTWTGALSVSRGTASTFVLADAGNMLSKLTAMSMSRAVWVMHQSVIPQLVSMNATSFNAWIQNTATSGVSLNGSTLLGLPIVFSEKMQPLGTAKDVALVDFGAYVIGDRAGLEIAFSEHYKFINRQGTWRFFVRRDGQPWLKDKITLADGSTTVSPVVYLS